MEPIEWGRVPAAVRGSGNLYAAADRWEKPPLEREQEAERGAADQKEIAARLEEAYRRGFQEAESASAREAEARTESAAARFAHAAADLATFRPRLRREAEGELVNLALAIAKRILRREIQMDPEALLGLVKAGLERVNRSDLLRVRIHPDFTGIVGNYLTANSAGAAVNVIPDKTLERGAAILETVRGRVDASIDAQLQEIERGFADLHR
jgi:flagellar assembly protein FliH